jgi:hypothetical protein
MGLSFGQYIGAVIGGAIGALVGALLLRFATRLVAKFVPPFGEAFLATLYGMTAAFLLGFAFVAIVRASENNFSGPAVALVTVINFLAYSVILRLMIKDPKVGPMGFGKACLVSFTQVITMVSIVGGVIWLVTAMIK